MLASRAGARITTPFIRSAAPPLGPRAWLCARELNEAKSATEQSKIATPENVAHRCWSRPATCFRNSASAQRGRQSRTPLSASTEARPSTSRRMYLARTQCHADLDLWVRCRWV